MSGQCTILYAAAGIIIILLLLAILLMYIRYRLIIREKSCGIIRQIQKQDAQAKELERARIEKEILLKIIDMGIRNISDQSQKDNTENNN